MPILKQHCEIISVKPRIDHGCLVLIMLYVWYIFHDLAAISPLSGLIGAEVASDLSHELEEFFFAKTLVF